MSGFGARPLGALCLVVKRAFRLARPLVRMSRVTNHLRPAPHQCVRQAALITALFAGLSSPSESLAENLTLEEFLPSVRNDLSIAIPPQVEARSSGAGTFAYPIPLPPGTGGLTPSLSLTYSSDRRNSEYGYGWQLEGLGRIERSTRKGAPTYTLSDDEFELDGALLVRESPTSNRYHLQDTDHRRVVYDSQADSWVVTTKDGTKWKYGSRPGAHSRFRQGANETGATYRWRLDEVEDPRGNAYRVDYEVDSFAIGSPQNLFTAHLYPSRIEYSFNPTAAPSMKPSRIVEFGWSTHRGDLDESGDPVDLDEADRPTSYRSGMVDQIRWRLASVRVGIDQNFDGVIEDEEQVARYAVEYAPKFSAELPDAPPFTQLIGIQRYGRFAPAGGMLVEQEFPKPTEFDYAAPPRAFSETRTPWSNPSGHSAIRSPLLGVPDDGIEATVIDLDGDGLPDRVTVGTDPANPRWEISRGLPGPGGGFAPPVVWPFDCQGASPSSCSDVLSPVSSAISQNHPSGRVLYEDWVLIDMNGDRRPDLVHGDSSPWEVHLNVGFGFAEPTTTWSLSHSTSDQLTLPPAGGRPEGFHSLRDMMDIDGDGRADSVTG